MAVGTGIVVASCSASIASDVAPVGFTPLHSAPTTTPDSEAVHALSASAILLRNGPQCGDGFFAIIPAAFIKPLSSLIPQNPERQHRGIGSAIDIDVVYNCLDDGVSLKLTTDGRTWYCIVNICTLLWTRTCGTLLLLMLVATSQQTHHALMYTSSRDFL